MNCCGSSGAEIVFAGDRDPIDQWRFRARDKQRAVARGLPISQVGKDFECVAPRDREVPNRNAFSMFRTTLELFDEFQDPEGDSLVSGDAVQAGRACRKRFANPYSVASCW